MYHFNLVLCVHRVPGVLRLLVWGAILVVVVLCAGGGFALLEKAQSESKNKSATQESEVEVEAGNTYSFVIFEHKF
jgi:hypothetical protein